MGYAANDAIDRLRGVLTAEEGGIPGFRKPGFACAALQELTMMGAISPASNDIALRLFPVMDAFGIVAKVKVEVEHFILRFQLIFQVKEMEDKMQVITTII